jgi:ABC-type sugar transport system substrate-binding protein
MPPNLVLRTLSGMTAAAALLGGLTACSESGTQSTSSGQAPSSPAGSSTGASGAVELAQRTIGILDVNASDPAAAQLEKSAIDATKTLGWKTVSVDAAGNPSKMAAGMKQLLVQKVDAILLDAVDPAAVTDGLREAKDRGVPVVLYGGQGTPSDLIAASIAPDDFTLASMATNYLVNAIGNKGKVAVMATDALTFSRNRTNLLKADLAGYPDIQLVDVHQVDYANYVNDVQTAVSALLKQNSDLSAIVTTVSPYATPVINALKRAGVDIPVIGFYDTPSNLDLIRSGGLTAVAATSFPQNAYQAVDALAQYLGRKTPIDGASQFLLPLRYTLVDSTNIDSASTTAGAGVDFKQFYERRWSDEFTNIS